MLAVKKGEAAPARAPQGWVEAEPYTPEKVYGPFKINMGRHSQTDPGETRMNPVTGMYAETLRDRSSEPFMSDRNLAAPQHEGGFGEKFLYVGGDPNGVADETARRPGESPEDFAARVQEWAKAQAATVLAGAAAVVAERRNTTPAGGPSDEELKALGGMTPDEVRTFAQRHGVDLTGLPKNVKRDDLVTHVRQVVKELYGRA